MGGITTCVNVFELNCVTICVSLNGTSLRMCVRGDTEGHPIIVNIGSGPGRVNRHVSIDEACQPPISNLEGN